MSSAAIRSVRRPRLQSLAIQGEDTTYLLYLDENGNVITDTWHASLEDALCHASFEYEGLHWREVTEL
jgi:hypothetical protein